MEKGIEPHAALSSMDWMEIAPIMDVQYRIYGKHDKVFSGADNEHTEPELPTSYQRIYNNKGQLTYAAIDSDGFFADKPEYWAG